MSLNLVPILADAIRGYYEENDIAELCDLYDIQLSYDGMKPAYVRLARDLIGGIGDPSKRHALKTIIESLLHRAREGAGKSKWDRQEYHRSMVDALTRVQKQLEDKILQLEESATREHILITPEEIASVLRADVKTVLSLLDSNGLDGFKIGEEWRIPLRSFVDFLKNRISDQRMKSLAANLQKPELWARAMEGFPNLKNQIVDTQYEEGTMGAFLKRCVAETKNEIIPSNVDNSQGVTHMPDAKKVFVVHGRDSCLKNDFFSFLRALSLQPIEWSEALKLTRKATPYIGEAIDSAFNNAQAVIVLLSPDDEVRLSPQLWKDKEEESEKKIRLQARPNVLFEAGMSFGRSSERTILIEIGQVKSFSDVAGLHVVRLSNSPETRNDIAERLKTAGCDVSTSGNDWLRIGNFEVTRKVVNSSNNADVRVEINEPKLKSTETSAFSDAYKHFTNQLSYGIGRYKGYASNLAPDQYKYTEAGVWERINEIKSARSQLLLVCGENVRSMLLKEGTDWLDDINLFGRRAPSIMEQLDKIAFKDRD